MGGGVAEGQILEKQNRLAEGLVPFGLRTAIGDRVADQRLYFFHNSARISPLTHQQRATFFSKYYS